MSGGEKGKERGAKELNLRPFAARAQEDGLPVVFTEMEEIDPALPAKELIGQAEAEKQPPARRGKPAPKGDVKRAKKPAAPKQGPQDHPAARPAGRRRPLTEREKLLIERRRRFNRFLTFCVAGVAVLAALLLTWFLLIVDAIEVEGCARFSPEEIIAESGLKTGRHMWLLNLAQARARIEENPYIEAAEIRRVYPDKLLALITEREEAAVIVGLNAQAVIDPKGYVLFIGARADYAGLIRITGMGFGGYHVGQRLGEESDFNSRTLVALLEAIYGAGIEGNVELVDMSNPLSVSILTLEGLTLHIGQPNDLDQKLANYRAVLPKLRQMGRAGAGTLDLSAMGDPVYSPGATAGGPDETLSPDQSPPPDQSPEPGASPPPGTDPTPSPPPGDPFSG